MMRNPSLNIRDIENGLKLLHTGGISEQDLAARPQHRPFSNTRKNKSRGIKREFVTQKGQV